MDKLFSIGFWSAVARFILRNRPLILVFIAVITVLLALQWKHMRFTYTEANLLPDDHEINIEYNKFLDQFGEEGNLIVIGVKDSALFTPENFFRWNKLAQEIGDAPEVDIALALGDLKKLVKRQDRPGFELKPFTVDTLVPVDKMPYLKYELFNKLPFYEGLIFNRDKNSVRTAIYLNKEIVNTAARKDFIDQYLIPKIEAFERDSGINVYTSGMPYIRTLNSQNIIDEIGMFIGAALLVTSLIFFYGQHIVNLLDVIVGHFLDIDLEVALHIF